MCEYIYNFHWNIMSRILIGWWILIQSGHWKTENPLIIFPNKIIKNLKNTFSFNIIQSFSDHPVSSLIINYQT